MLRVKKGMSSRVWELVVLAVVGDAFGLGGEVCGVVLVTKGGEYEIHSGACWSCRLPPRLIIDLMIWR
jgi:hypothetical protein